MFHLETTQRILIKFGIGVLYRKFGLCRCSIPPALHEDDAKFYTFYENKKKAI